jgi:hypothetical protein
MRKIGLDHVITYFNNKGQVHRINGPAIIYPNGTCWWFKDGLTNIDGFVSAIYSDGEVWINLNGQRTEIQNIHNP